MNINKRATIKEVARTAGVSTQTVSRVINDRPDVSPETRERIHQVIAELNFQPSALARSLIQQRSYTLGVVTAGLKYPWPLTYVRWHYQYGRATQVFPAPGRAASF